MAKRKPTEGKSNDPPLSAGKTRTEVSIYDKYSSKIRDLYLELDQYEFFHSPFAFDLPDRRFIGRQKVVSRLKMILRNSKTKSGAYLITGFRGMGKTSIVRKAIREVNLEHVPKEKKRERPFWEIVNPLRNRKLRRVLGILFLLVLAYYLAYFLFANDHGPWHWDKPFHLEDFGALGSRLLELLRWPTFKEPFLNNLLKLAFLFLFLFLFGGFVFWLTEWMLSRVDRKKKSKWNRFEPIEINLPQEEIREEDVLKQIAKQLYLYLQKFEQSNFTRHRRIYWVVRRLIYLPRFLFSNVSLSGYVQLQRTLKQLESLNRRINAQVSNLQELTVNPSFAPSIFGGLARMPLSIFGFSSKDQLNYPIASAKEIEQELIEIFRNIDDIRVKKEVNYQLLVPEFIFIIDELDKIEPNYNYNIGDREASDPSFDDQKSKFATERIRKRQETVARLLANLKSFLNVAMAKFIFIGGREMYDASLADIADRDSFYSSIFHDIIYVNSFFKDKIEVRSGVTRMTEAYLVSLLLPEAYLDRYIQKLHPDTTKGEPYRAPYYSLRVYYQYLLDLFCEHPLVKKDIEDQAWRELPFSTPGDLVHTDVLQAKQKAFKIIFLLQNFIIFLTYRSNGTPKKLVGLVEDYMSPYRKVLADAGEKYLQVDNPFADGQEHQDRVFLRFNYNQQYEIGLTSNLYRPYLIIHSRYLKALGDKFLFSNAFIIDHLLKFHPFGFSWRNLELIPEIILINKEPNLRSFIGDVISFMSNIMIRHTTSGLFQLKFYNKTANELKFISKISDLSAAAFNFTLDESLLIKRHYKKKLQELRNNYQHYDQQGLGNRYIHSMGFIQTILGDLHFYDKEFDDALLFYTDSIQTLRVPYDEKRITKHQVILLIRNRLKIGLTLEKMRAFDSAFSIYRELILDTPVFLRRLVDGEERGEKGEKGEKGEEGEKGEKGEKGGVSSVGLRPYRGVQLLNKSFIAWLGLVEKQRFDGITLANVEKNREEFFRLIQPVMVEKCEHLIDLQRINVLKSDYCANVGSILYYKNKNFGRPFWEVMQEFPLLEQLKEKIHQASGQGLYKASADYLPSISGFHYYWEAVHFSMESIAVQMNDGPGAGFRQATLLQKVVKLLADELNYLTNANFLFNVGNILSKLGDAVLTFLTQQNAGALDPALLQLYWMDEKVERESLIEQIGAYVNDKLANGEDADALLSINTPLFFYRLAGLYYQKASRTYSYAFQYKKFLFVLKDHLVMLRRQLFMPEALANEEQDLPKREVFWKDGLLGEIAPSNLGHASPPAFSPTELFERIAIKTFSAITWEGDITNRPQILKYRDIFQHDEQRDLDLNAIYTNLSTAPEVREVILLVEELKLKLERIAQKATFEKESEAHSEGRSLKIFRFNYVQDLLSPHGAISHKFTRMLELKFRCEQNFFVLHEALEMGQVLTEEYVRCKKDERQTKLDEVREKIAALRTNPDRQALLQQLFGREGEKPEEVLAFLVCDSIFCLHEVIKTIEVYGLNYMTSYTYLATAHYKMANWCRGFTNLELLCRNEEERRQLKQTLKDLLGTDATYYLEPNYHNELAIQHFYAAVQMHNEGKSYKDKLNDMYFLEDDFNDNLYHFCAASERYRLNLNIVRDKITALKAAVSDSRLYKYDSYRDLNHRPDKVRIALDFGAKQEGVYHLVVKEKKKTVELPLIERRLENPDGRSEIELPAIYFDSFFLLKERLPILSITLEREGEVVFTRVVDLNDYPLQEGHSEVEMAPLVVDLKT